MYDPRIKTFMKTAELGSFSKAGEALHITPTAVIKQMNLLECELNLTLFIRTHRGLTLTKSGQSLYRDAAYLIQYAKDALERARKVKEAAPAVRIGTSPMTPAQFLVDSLAEVYQQYPDMQFRCVPFANTPENAREILKHLGEHIDIVTGIYDDAFLKSRKCQALPLCQMPICCGVSIHHELAQKNVLTYDDLCGRQLMVIQPGWNTYIDTMREDLQYHHAEIQIIDFPFYDLDVFNECENNQAILTVVPEWASTHPLIQVIPVDWNYTVPFGILYSQHPTPYIQRFLDIARSVLGNFTMKY